VIQARHTYRQAYCLAVNARAGRPDAVCIDDVHALKRDPAYNAPWDTVRALLEMAGLPAADADVDAALLDARQWYAGDALSERLYGAAPPTPRGPGLYEGDRLLIPPDLPPLPVPIAVFTGRDGAEARWVIGRLALFATLRPEHLWHAGNGVAKPDPAAFATCLSALHPAGPILYLGDLAADAELVCRYRAACPAGPPVVFVMVGDEGPADRADLALPAATPLLEALLARP